LPCESNPDAGWYRQFIEHLAAQFAGGKRFLDDLPRESLADDAELEALAAPSSPSTGTDPQR
jgi:hypothetical protein